MGEKYDGVRCFWSPNDNQMYPSIPLITPLSPLSSLLSPVSPSPLVTYLMHKVLSIWIYDRYSPICEQIFWWHCFGWRDMVFDFMLFSFISLFSFLCLFLLLIWNYLYSLSFIRSGRGLYLETNGLIQANLHITNWALFKYALSSFTYYIVWFAVILIFFFLFFIELFVLTKPLMSWPINHLNTDTLSSYRSSVVIILLLYLFYLFIF